MADLTKSSDGELVQQTLAGGHEAYRELVGRYQGHVHGLAYSLAGDWAEAQDIAQEAFIRAYSNLDQLRDPAKFAAWLRRVAFGVAMDWLRTFRPKLFEKLDGRVDLDRLEIPDFQPGPPEIAAKRELADAVLAAVASLPPKYRVPLTMFHLDGLSYKKVAAFLDIPLGTAKSMIHRAKAKLKAALPAAIAKEMTPMVQEVFDEHKLTPEFSREVWNLCIDWMCSDDCDALGGPLKRDKARAERIAQAVARNVDVAAVTEWRRQAEPLPQWAAHADREMPRWGIEICHHDWVEQLQRVIWMIGEETVLPDPSRARCGLVPLRTRQWAVLVRIALGQWLADAKLIGDASTLPKEVYDLLGPRDDDKSGAARLLRDALLIVVEGSVGDIVPDFKKLNATSQLAETLMRPICGLAYPCGYRWEKIVLEICRAIGDPEYRTDRPRAWHVGSCNGQLAFIYRDDPARVPATCAILVGLWAWLKDVAPENIESNYADLGPLAERVCEQLGKMTPVKRWLAGRLFVGIRIWLQEVDHGDIKQPKPAMDPYPSLRS